MADDGPDLAAAVAALRRGDLVVYPTETVYGLGADALDAAAVERVGAQPVDGLSRINYEVAAPQRRDRRREVGPVVGHGYSASMAASRSSYGGNSGHSVDTHASRTVRSPSTTKTAGRGSATPVMPSRSWTTP